VSALRVMLVGADGQVALACRRAVPANVDLHVFGRADLDIADEAGVASGVAKLRPDLIINAAAYTAVDKAESEPDAARRANSVGPRNLARALSSLPAGRMIHLS
jgi:dTDP-4-dehydrorhamnose reductase